MHMISENHVQTIHIDVLVVLLLHASRWLLLRCASHNRGVKITYVCFRVGGMTCGHCTAAVEKALQVLYSKPCVCFWRRASCQAGTSIRNGCLLRAVLARLTVHSLSSFLSLCSCAARGIAGCSLFSRCCSWDEVVVYTRIGSNAQSTIMQSTQSCKAHKAYTHGMK